MWSSCLSRGWDISRIFPRPEDDLGIVVVGRGDFGVPDGSHAFACCRAPFRFYSGMSLAWSFDCEVTLHVLAARCSVLVLYVADMGVCGHLQSRCAFSAASLSACSCCWPLHNFAGRRVSRQKPAVGWCDLRPGLHVQCCLFRSRSIWPPTPRPCMLSPLAVLGMAVLCAGPDAYRIPRRVYLPVDRQRFCHVPGRRIPPSHPHDRASPRSKFVRFLVPCRYIVPAALLARNTSSRCSMTLHRDLDAGPGGGLEKPSFRGWAGDFALATAVGGESVCGA